MSSDPGCRVRDDGRPGPCGLLIEDHILRDGRWIHPVGMNRQGRWIWDEDDYCHRTDNACSGRACWVCRGDAFTTTSNTTNTTEGHDR